MITLNDYLYDGDTIFAFYEISMIKKKCKRNQNEIDPDSQSF